MKISVIGAGYVGLITGLGFAEIGHQVMCFDHDLEKINKLQSKVMPIFEAGAEKLLQKHENKNICFTANFEKAVEFSNIVFLCINLDTNKNSAKNLHFLYTLIVKIAGLQTGDTFIVMKSTAPVGTHTSLVKKLNLTKKSKIHLTTNPEFLSEGEGIKNFLYPHRIIIASDSKMALRKIRNIYRPLITKKSPLIEMKPSSAEMTKHAANSFLATKISFINEISRICEHSEADIADVQKGLGLDPRIGSKFINPGLGYGGSCLPKDVSALIQLAKSKNDNLHLLKSVKKTNDLQMLNISLKIKSTIKNNKMQQITIWGASYKPGTDDIRNSSAVIVIKSLLTLGVKINVFDPKALDNLKNMNLTGSLSYFNEPYASLKNSEFLIILTDWQQFLSVDMRRMKKIMKRHFIFDARNIYSPTVMRKLGFHYNCIGRQP